MFNEEFFLDSMPVSYVIYTERDQRMMIVGIEVAEQHWDKLNRVPQSSFGLLPLYVGGADSLKLLFETLPKEELEEIILTILPAQAKYVENPSEENLNELLKVYKEISHE